VQAAEAVRHLGGALNDGLDVFMLLRDDGVYLARDGQQDREGGWTALAPVLSRLIAKGAPVLMHAPSARQRGLLDGGPLIPGVTVADDRAVADALDGTSAVMTF
jgi:sulfur relay (sulfurtransferase) DsrF/TusC family protein